MDVCIKEIQDEEQLKQSVEIIVNSFKTVADQFKLTIHNCPTHPSFVTGEKLKDMRKKNGISFFGLFCNNDLKGFIALEKACDELYYIEKLSVLPEYRHKRYGRMLVEYVFDKVKDADGKKISIGIINESKLLKDWYSDLGFSEVGTKKFNHLPFTVCFMEKNF